MSYCALKLSNAVGLMRISHLFLTPVQCGLVQRTSVRSVPQPELKPKLSGIQSGFQCGKRSSLLHNSVCTTEWRGQTFFHTTPRRNIPPVLVIILKPLAKAASIITGRTLRNWWKRQSEEGKDYWRSRFLEKRLLLLAGSSLLVFGGLVHYFTHIKETPVTGRRRYLAFNDKQFKELAEFEYSVQLENVKDKIVPPDHPVYKRVSNVVQKIVNSNQDYDYMRQQAWTIVVVDSEEMNAFVIPTGHIFVFTGLLKIVENDSQLAVVLGHEMAHGLLSHAAEQVSFATVVDVFIIVVMAAIWAFMPTDGIAIVTQWFYNKAVQIMLHLPYNRKLEEEADYVGLLMMAKACFDVRESSVFWNKMALKSQLSNDKNSVDVELPQWLSTHPNSENRAQFLDSLIPKASDLRLICECPKLPDRDPRADVAYLRHLLNEKKALEAASRESKITAAAAGVTVTALREPIAAKGS